MTADTNTAAAPAGELRERLIARASRHGFLSISDVEQEFAALAEQTPAASQVDLEEVCRPWRFHVGEPPEYDSPLAAVFGAGMSYTEALLARHLGVKSYEGGDGSEDFDQDATQTLENILMAAGLYDPEDDRWAVLPAASQVAGAGEVGLRSMADEMLTMVAREPLYPQWRDALKRWAAALSAAPVEAPGGGVREAAEDLFKTLDAIVLALRVLEAMTHSAGLKPAEAKAREMLTWATAACAKASHVLTVDLVYSTSAAAPPPPSPAEKTLREALHKALADVLDKPAPGSWSEYLSSAVDTVIRVLETESRHVR